MRIQTIQLTMVSYGKHTAYIEIIFWVKVNSWFLRRSYEHVKIHVSSALSETSSVQVNLNWGQCVDRYCVEYSEERQRTVQQARRLRKSLYPEAIIPQRVTNNGKGKTVKSGTIQQE